MKWNEFRKFAESKGWRLLKHGSNHDIYTHPEKPDYLIIGRHGKEEIKKGTFRQLMRVVGK